MSEERARYRVDHEVGAELELRPETLLEYGDPAYANPTPDEIRQVLKAGDLTGSRAGTLVGVNGRTIRKWTGGEQKISYSAWRMLLQRVGLAPSAEQSALLNEKDVRKELMRAFGQRLRKARQEAGYQEAAELADELMVEPPRYRRYERGETVPPIDVLLQIRRLTSTSLDWLYTGE